MRSALVAAFCLAIGAAFVLPKLREARERGRLKQTMGAIRTIASAVESYGVDNGMIPIADSMERLASILEPVFVKQLPLRDGWGNRIEYRAVCVAGGSLGDGPPTGYAIRSAGSDGAWDFEDFCDYPGGGSSRFEQDIVYGGCSRER